MEKMTQTRGEYGQEVRAVAGQEGIVTSAEKETQKSAPRRGHVQGGGCGTWWEN